MAIQARSIEDAEMVMNLATDGDNEPIEIPGSTNKIIEFGNNFNGYIHSFIITIGEQDGGAFYIWNPIIADFQACDGGGCSHSTACIGFNVYPDTTSCVQSTYIYIYNYVGEISYDYCTDFDSMLGCQNCLLPAYADTGSPILCVCDLPESGVTPNKVCGCGWSCATCADSTTCASCIVQTGVDPALPCGCLDGYWDTGNSCISNYIYILYYIYIYI